MYRRKPHTGTFFKIVAGIWLFGASLWLAAMSGIGFVIYKVLTRFDIL